LGRIAVELGVEEGVGDGLGIGLGLGDGDGLGLGDGLGTGIGLGLGDGIGLGEGEGESICPHAAVIVISRSIIKGKDKTISPCIQPAKTYPSRIGVGSVFTVSP